MKNRFDADAGRPDEARFVGFFIESRTGNIQVDPRRAVVDELLEEEACRNRAGFGTADVLQIGYVAFQELFIFFISRQLPYLSWTSVAAWKKWFIHSWSLPIMPVRTVPKAVTQAPVKVARSMRRVAPFPGHMSGRRPG